MNLEESLRRKGFEFDEDIVYNVIIKGGEKTISKYFDNDAKEDLCKHEWKIIEEKREAIERWNWDCEVYICERNGCLKFKFFHRTSFELFLYFFRRMPIIRELLPRKGAFYTPHRFAREYGLSEEALQGYLELIKGLDIDGRLAYVEVGNKKFFYRYDVDQYNKPINLPLSLEDAKFVSEALREWEEWVQRTQDKPINLPLSLEDAKFVSEALKEWEEWYQKMEA